MNCTYCGAPLKDGALVCEACGKKVKAPKQRRLRNRRACAIIGFIFGILGLITFPLIIDSIIAIILSALGITSTKSGIAKAGVILGFVSLLAAFILYIVLLSTGGAESITDFLFKNFLNYFIV